MTRLRILSWRIFNLCFVIQVIKGQTCLQVGNGNGLPVFDSYKIDGDNEIVRHHQAIITSYTFDCNEMCGNITEWGVDVQPGGKYHENGQYSLDLQVWRPSPTVDDSTGTGCYSLVGNNRFTSIPLQNNLALLTPSPQDYIQFQSGDVLGFYVEEASGSNDGVVLLNTGSFTRESVWHASIAPNMAASQSRDCPYSVGSNGGVLNILTRAAPVISISTATFPCPPLPSTATTQPTPPPPNPTTDSEETPPTTNQQTQEPVDPLTTTTSISGESPSSTKSATEVPSTSIPAAFEPKTPASTFPIGLTIGIIVCTMVMVIIATTVAVSIAVCWKMGKFKSLPFHLQRNLAYRGHGVSAENMAFRGVTASGGYSYPMVDVVAHETTPTDAPIITKSNKAYGSRNTTRQNNSINEAVRPDHNAQVPTDKIVPIGTCASEKFHDQQVEQSDIYAMPTKAVTIEEENHASIEYCYITSEEDQQLTDVAFYDSICAITNDSGTCDTKYDYILD